MFWWKYLNLAVGIMKCYTKTIKLLLFVVLLHEVASTFGPWQDWLPWGTCYNHIKTRKRIRTQTHTYHQTQSSSCHGYLNFISKSLIENKMYLTFKLIVPALIVLLNSSFIILLVRMVRLAKWSVFENMWNGNYDTASNQTLRSLCQPLLRTW